MKLRPLQDRIIVKRVEEETMTAGGIFIPETAKEKPQKGEIVAVGHGKKTEDGKVVPIDVKAGDKVLVEQFAVDEFVDVTGVSKGQGFAGTVKRHNFARGPKTHGSDNYRKPGSIGPGTTPGRVYKGLRMGGHMGSERVTIKKLRVVRVDAERNLILVKGSVPGAPGALTFVRKA